MPLRIGLYLPGASGPPSGVWTRLRALARGLAQRCDVELFAATVDPAAAADLGIPSECTWFIPASSGLLRLVRVSQQVRTFAEKYNLDLVQVEAPPVPQRSGHPVIFSLHDLRAFDLPVYQLRSSGELYQRFMLRRHLRSAAAVLALSQWASSDISARLRVPGNRLHVIAPIAPVAPAPSQRPPGPKVGALAGRPFVVAIGHLERRKNLGLLVQATHEPDWPENLVLALAGSDHGSEQELRKAAVHSPRPIAFLGAVSEEEKWWLLRRAQIVVLPSRLEGFGIVVLEGMAAGTPVLVADASALPEAVGVDEAVLSVDRPEEWSVRIRQLYEEPAERQRLVARQAGILRKHSDETITSQLADVYRAVTAAS